MITTPLIIFAILRFRKLTNWAPFLTGLAVFFVVNLTFENLVRANLLAEESAVGHSIRSNPFVYTIAAGIVTALFYECVAYVIFKYVLKESNKRCDGLSYGAGVALISSIAQTLFTTFIYAVYAGYINQLGPEQFVEQADDAEAAQEVLDYLLALPNSEIVLMLLDGLIGITVSVCLAMIVFYSVKKQAPQFLGLACALRLCSIIPGALSTTDVIPKGLPGFLLDVFFGLVILYFAARLFREYDRRQVKTLKELFTPTR